MIYDLLLTFTGPKGCDSTGVPLRNSDRIWDIWDCQQCHIACIQDPADVQPYTKTRQLTKGDLTLPTYRSARGSTSLESFHLHINRFIPGTSASAKHFQLYLLEGSETYSGALYHSLNELSYDVQNIGIYTGECIGVEYLFKQTGEVLEEEEEVKQNYLMKNHSQIQVTQELLEKMVAEDNSSGEESESGCDSSDDDDLELLLLQNVFTPRTRFDKHHFVRLVNGLRLQDFYVCRPWTFHSISFVRVSKEQCVTLNHSVHIRSVLVQLSVGRDSLRKKKIAIYILFTNRGGRKHYLNQIKSGSQRHCLNIHQRESRAACRKRQEAMVAPYAACPNGEPDSSCT
ncbi:hypothetical protein P5673_030520 [Acropora cervicornis]|uniref:Uncharacterized protein n=1 Tax=Acropora cervicornis TaxID=6130 RepID=A0AAD9PUE8_ACRCE|nr:hypothetical protein P5673_030520 [Acropora cervicornis]